MKSSILWDREPAVYFGGSLQADLFVACIMLISSLPLSSTLKMVSTYSWETSVVLHRNTKNNKQTNSVALSPRATATCRQNLVPTFVDRGVSRGQRGKSPTVVNLSFLDRNRHFSFK
jgi:hypothetical protein